MNPPLNKTCYAFNSTLSKSVSPVWYVRRLCKQLARFVSHKLSFLAKSPYVLLPTHVFFEETCVLWGRNSVGIMKNRGDLSKFTLQQDLRQKNPRKKRTFSTDWSITMYMILLSRLLLLVKLFANWMQTPFIMMNVWQHDKLALRFT